MFEMNVPYDKGTMKISLPEKNLAGVLGENRANIPPNFLKKNW